MKVDSVKKSSQTFLDGYLTGYRGVSKCDWLVETVRTWAFFPVILFQKLIQLCLSITGMDLTTLKRPIALLTPVCATAEGTAQLLRFPKVCNIHGRGLMAAITVCSQPQR